MQTGPVPAGARCTCKHTAIVHSLAGPCLRAVDDKGTACLLLAAKPGFTKCNCTGFKPATAATAAAPTAPAPAPAPPEPEPEEPDEPDAIPDVEVDDGEVEE